MLPKWGVVWQTKDFVRDEVSAPAAHNGDFLYEATILGRVNGRPDNVLPFAHWVKI